MIKMMHSCQVYFTTIKIIKKEKSIYSMSTGGSEDELWRERGREGARGGSREKREGRCGRGSKQAAGATASSVQEALPLQAPLKIFIVIISLNATAKTQR